MISAANKGKLLNLVTVYLVLVVAFAFSVSAAYRWEGNVTIGTNTSTGGAVVAGYSGPNLMTGSVRVGEGFGTPSNGYVITLGCSAGDSVFLKVWGINASAATCNLGPATGNASNLSVSLVASGGSCSYSAACSTAFCCSGGAEVNDGVTAGACASTCTVSAPADNSGSGGGGSSSSGGGGGGAAYASESSKTVTVSGAKATSVSFTKASSIAVQTVSLKTTSTAAVTNGKVTVKETSVASSMSLESGNVKAYKYLSITKQNIKDADLAEATVTFEVPASWVSSNRIDPATVKLNRYVSGQWTTLATKLVSSSSTKYVFEAVTPGFSTFAISGEQLPEKLTAFQLIDIIRDFYAGKSAYSAFDIIDFIREFYA